MALGVQLDFYTSELYSGCIFGVVKLLKHCICREKCLLNNFFENGHTVRKV